VFRIGIYPSDGVFYQRRCDRWPIENHRPTLGASAIVRDIRNTIFAPTQAGLNGYSLLINSDAGAVNFVTSDSSAVLPVRRDSSLVSVAAQIVTLQFANTNSFGLQAPALIGGSVPALNLSTGSAAIDNASSTGCHRWARTKSPVRW
jgi:hypothetical protein